jgi:hypothetical protein
MAANGIISWPGVQNLAYRLAIPSVLLDRDQILRRHTDSILVGGRSPGSRLIIPNPICVPSAYKFHCDL